MKASEFVEEFASHGLAAWEAKVYDSIIHGDAPDFSLYDVPVETQDGKHKGTFQTTGDYLTVGEPGDTMRMPLTPGMAQKVADYYGMLLPTSRMVDAIWNAAIKLEPHPMAPNKYVNLSQFLEHSRIVDEQLSGFESTLTAGQKKDVIVAKTVPTGKVIIYGWHRPNGTPIQPRSSIHSADYLDYSHGIRLVGPMMEVDRRTMKTTDVLKDPELSQLISDQGPVDVPRYGGPLKPGQRGFQIVQGWGDALFSSRVP